MTENHDQNGEVLDVVVVGGGVAGLSGALTLARARRSVVVVDAAQPRNAPAGGVHGYLTRDGMSPAELLETGTAEVVRYGGRVLRARVVAAGRDGDRFTVTTDDGQQLTARRLLVASGLVDELPDVPGVRERWGRDVLHCPYCHGWEVRDQRIGVLATGPAAVGQALLFRQWSSAVTLFLHTAADLTGEQGEQLAARDVAVVDGEVTGLEVTRDRLSGVRLRGGRLVPVAALVVAPRYVARSDVLADLGLATVEHPWGVGRHYEADASGLTAVPGVWAAGNVTDLVAGVPVAAAAGVTAAAAINHDLVVADTVAAVARRRSRAAAPFSAASESRSCDGVLGDRRHGLETLLDR